MSLEKVQPSFMLSDIVTNDVPQDMSGFPTMTSSDKLELDCQTQAVTQPQNIEADEEESSSIDATGSKMTLLPEDFVPLPYSVLFGRGKKCTNACGNRRLRIICTMYLARYAKVMDNKDEKSEIVSEIYSTVKEACRNNAGLGAFIRNIDGRWYEVEMTVAREKISQFLRDLLHTKYRSSMKSKIANRRQRRIESTRKSSIVSTESNSSTGSDILGSFNGDMFSL